MIVARLRERMSDLRLPASSAVNHAGQLLRGDEGFGVDANLADAARATPLHVAAPHRMLAPHPA